MTNYLPKILITGGHGQLGLALQHHPLAKNYSLIACTHDQLDITNPVSISDVITATQPDIIINTAAYTAVDQAETAREMAFQVNHLGAKHLAMACHLYRLPLVHISTAYVFDGHKDSPYLETDMANPLSVYGESKWLGEQEVEKYCEQSIILRITSVFSEFGHNFVKTMLALAMKKTELSVIADQITSPTYAGDIAQALFTIVKQPIHFGIYHYCNRSPVSWYAFAAAIINEAKQYAPLAIDTLRATTSAEYQTAAKRPANSALDCYKIEKDYGILQVNWEEAVKKIIPPLIQYKD